MFSIEDVTKIANLSSLEITEEETEIFAHQFSTILDYFEVLDSIDVPSESVDRDESSMVIFREDKTEVSSVSPEQFSPYTENRCFKVPKVVDDSN
ncbi:MAG: Asp-tRNA(Asn)/Glu-tRNA(Gln) amidotransferase subunit GatC [SAR324 cluster bacterium]|nr:Asp-tRNA(Asn)/Glu-tRNA(Gln) amidotransferase subunit GatC [SAR324 cluster bacterium]